ncbi:MAG: M48 family metalloprotease [Deltaproteobacteria bacterium]|nr:M48 family metalloprotease [Deltaproteobacteria bacterium]
MWTTLLVVNVIQGLVALVWMQGFRRIVAPRSPELSAALGVLGLMLPPIVMGAHALDPIAWPDTWIAVRTALWIQRAIEIPPVPWLLALFFVGTTLVFLVQELLPALGRRRARRRASTSSDPRWTNALVRVTRAAQIAQMADTAKTARVTAAVVETQNAFAAAAGFGQPAIQISRGLLDRLADDELDAVMAHELGHIVRGGNGRRLLIWLLRGLQAPSPAALICFRTFVEVEEEACDAWAARLLKTPGALARALIEVERQRARLLGPGSPEAAAPRRAFEIVEARASFARTQIRVRRLLDEGFDVPLSKLVMLPSAALLGGLLWLIR